MLVGVFGAQNINIYHEFELGTPGIGGVYNNYTGKYYYHDC